MIVIRKTMIPDYQGPRLPPEVQMKRILAVIDNELTEKQQVVFRAYYLEQKNTTKIAQELGIHKSSVSRCLQRAEKRVRMCLKY